MTDLRPDTVFVVTAPVWEAFCTLREAWSGDANTGGFHDACAGNIRAAQQSGDTAAEDLWRQVKCLGALYGVSWVSAVEVDGALLREAEKQLFLVYPDDSRLKRVIIAEQARLPAGDVVLDTALKLRPKRKQDGSLHMTLMQERREGPAGINRTGLDLTIGPDGDIRISGYYAGPLAKEFWGDSDHEFWLTIPQALMPELLAIILRYSCRSEGPLTWAALLQLLEENGLPCDVSSW